MSVFFAHATALPIMRTVVLVPAIKILHLKVQPRKRFQGKRISRSSITTAHMRMAVRLRKSISVGQNTLVNH